jgi:hypothetical protein
MSTPKSPPLEVGRASKLSSKLRLDQIALHELSAKHVAGHEAPKLAFAVDLGTVSYASREDDVVAVFPLGVTIQHQGEGTTLELAQLMITTRVFYRHETTWTAEDEAYLPDYLGLVGWMHTWPYARAEVQGLSVKLGFPALLLPVLLSGQTAEVIVQRIGAPPVEPPPAARPAPMPAKRRRR